VFGKAKTVTRQPRAEATIYSADLEELKATFFLLSLQVVDSLNLQQDQFVLNLAPRASLTRMGGGQPEYEDPGIDDILGWADLIEPNDLVLIKLYDAALNWIPDENDHLQNYGLYLVDRVSVRMGFSGDGKVQRMIMVMGRGLGKLFTEHTLARFPSIGGTWGDREFTQEKGETDEEYDERVEAATREQIKVVKELGIVPTICGDLTYYLFLAGEEQGLFNTLDKVLKNILRNDELTDGLPLLFGNALMKMRYGYATKDRTGETGRDTIELADVLDLTSNIHVRDGCGIDAVDATGMGQEQGPILGLLRAIAAPPFYEIFIRAMPQAGADLAMKAFLCVRSSPFDSVKSDDTRFTPQSVERYPDSGQYVYQPFWYLDGVTPTKLTGDVPHIPQIEPWEIISFDIGRSDGDTYTFFQGSPNSEIVDLRLQIEALIPGFYPGPFPDFSGGTGGGEKTNAEASAWIEAHRQIQDRDGPDERAGTALLRRIDNPSNMETVYNELRGLFTEGEDIGATHRFGVKVMQVQNRFYPKELIGKEGEENPDPDGAQILKLLFQQTALLADWFSMNPHYMSGKLIIAGRTDIMKGGWVEVNVSASGRSDQDQFVSGEGKARRLRFYVEQVEQSFQFGGNWTTTLTVTRGEYIIEE